MKASYWTLLAPGAPFLSTTRIYRCSAVWPLPRCTRILTPRTPYVEAIWSRGLGGPYSNPAHIVRWWRNWIYSRQRWIIGFHLIQMSYFKLWLQLNSIGSFFFYYEIGVRIGIVIGEEGGAMPNQTITQSDYRWTEREREIGVWIGIAQFLPRQHQRLATLAYFFPRLSIFGPFLLNVWLHPLSFVSL